MPRRPMDGSDACPGGRKGIRDLGYRRQLVRHATPALREAGGLIEPSRELFQGFLVDARNTTDL